VTNDAVAHIGQERRIGPNEKYLPSRVFHCMAFHMLLGAHFSNAGDTEGCALVGLLSRGGT
jgi:hypothetical protein